MSLWELLVIAVGLSMDAFAVSICKGLSVQKVKPKHYLIVGAYFGGFQALMPLLGYLLGVRFEAMVANVDHWIAFVLLGLIGANMVRESRAEEEKLDDSFTVSTMLLLAIATSIDALAIGVTFAFLGVNIIEAIILIGITTGIISGVGLKIGNVFGSRYKSKAEMAGGIVLILMGIKILAQHLLGLG
ncbi:manganese efflux pump MntP family protein [Kineothrix sp. MSJ-39]|uniref:manganese efflux pump MntP n=1 Tax=Kineothrix sp. MSJ-39 TaxID=2841533 RepID=UPI001C10E3CE|nr:manganese efflux pump MntP family protein [Kineothrix sp. MSJ-39]MBU5429497.1 manganese efflux pump MntP family protein [Kineothrix sp. MSJ-39]